MAGTGTGGNDTPVPFRVGQKWRAGSADHVDTITELNHEKQTIHYLCGLDGAVHVTGMVGARDFWILIEDVPDLPPIQAREPEQPKWMLEHARLMVRAERAVTPESMQAYVALARELRKVNS